MLDKGCRSRWRRQNGVCLVVGNRDLLDADSGGQVGLAEPKLFAEMSEWVHISILVRPLKRVNSRSIDIYWFYL